MTDDTSPTTQFHPYQKPADVPVAERQPSGMGRIGRKVGLDPLRMRASLERGRAWARRHPGRLLGGMALAVIGAGLLRGRIARRSSAAPAS